MGNIEQTLAQEQKLHHIDVCLCRLAGAEGQSDGLKYKSIFLPLMTLANESQKKLCSDYYRVSTKTRHPQTFSKYEILYTPKIL